MSKRLKWIVPLCFASALAGLFFFIVQHAEIVRVMRLTNCTNDTVRFQLTVPKGSGFSLVLGTPELTNHTGLMSQEPPYPFSGRVRISEPSSSIVEFPVGSDRANSCNWLHRKGIPVGFILTWHLNSYRPGLDRFLAPQKTYDVEVHFDTPPSTNATLWLHWIQHAADRDPKQD